MRGFTYEEVTLKEVETYRVKLSHASGIGWVDLDELTPESLKWLRQQPEYQKFRAAEERARQVAESARIQREKAIQDKKEAVEKRLAWIKRDAELKAIADEKQRVATEQARRLDAERRKAEAAERERAYQESKAAEKKKAEQQQALELEAYRREHPGPTIWSQIRDMVLQFGICLLAVWLYFLPARHARGTDRSSAILLTNLFFGWTIIGWVASLIWAAAEVQTKASATATQRDLAGVKDD